MNLFVEISFGFYLDEKRTIKSNNLFKTEMLCRTQLTCKLAISERPARFHTMLAGGFASASQRNINESLPSSKSICGAPSNRMVGASINKNESKPLVNNTTSIALNSK